MGLAGCSADGGMGPPFARLRCSRVAEEEEALAVLGERQGLFVGGRGRPGFGGEGSETQALMSHQLQSRSTVSTRGCGWGDTGRTEIRQRTATLTLLLREQMQRLTALNVPN